MPANKPLIFSPAEEENTLYFRHVTKEHGLPSDVIRYVTQDVMGYMWIGTDNGLVRYDGHRMTVFQHNPDNPHSIAENVVHTIYQSRDSLLWIGLEKGFSVFNPFDGLFTNYHDRQGHHALFPAAGVSRFWEDHDASMWIATNNGLHHLQKGSPRATSLLRYDPAVSFRENLLSRVNNLAMHPKDNTLLVVATQGGLLFVDKNTHSVVLDLNEDWQERQPSRGLYFDSDTILYVGDWAAGLKKLNLNTLEWELYDFPISPLDIQKKNDDALWLATPNMGLVIFNKKNNTFTAHSKSASNPRSLLSNYLQCNIFIDRNQTLWVGGKEGLNILDRAYLSFSKISPPFGIQNIRSFFRDLEAGKTYFGTDSEYNVIYWDEFLGEWDYVRHGDPDVLPHARISYLYKDNRGVIWATSAANNLLYIDPETHTLKMFRDANNQPVAFNPERSRLYHITEDHHKNLWISAPFDGIIKLDSQRKHASYFRNIPGDSNSLFRSQRYLELMVDHKNRLWIGSYNGMGVYDIDRETFVDDLFHGMKEMNLWGQGCGGFAIDSLNNIWVCMHRKGLLRISENAEGFSYKLFHTVHGLNDTNVSRIAVDSKGHFWVINEGLLHFNPYNESMNAYDNRNGLHSTKSFDDMMYIDPDDQIFITGTNGIEMKDLNKLEIGGNIIHLLIEQIEVNGSEFISLFPSESPPDIILMATQNNIRLYFTAICFQDVFKIRYEYQLIGYDEEINRLENHEMVNYANLPPGTYRFVIRAAHRGIWHEEEASLTFTIKPRFHQTLWFKAGSVMLVALLITTIIHIRSRQIRSREKIKSEFSKMVAEAEMKSLRAQMNPHFIFNSLNSINTFILKNQTETASDYLTKFSRLIRAVLQNSKNKLVSLEDELNALQIYLELEQLRFSKKFDFSIIIDQFLDTNRVFVPPLLLQPYVENALWHGLMQKEGHGRINITVHKNGEHVIFSIQDDGVGRKKAAEYRSQFNVKSKSMGMSITSDRIAIINKLYGSETKIAITDLFDTRQQAAGTRVDITLPIITNL